MRFGLLTLAALFSAGAVHHHLRHPSAPPARHSEARLSTDRYGHLFLTNEKIKLSVDGVSEGATLQLVENDAAGRLVRTQPSQVLGGTVELGEMPAGWYRIEPNGAEEGAVEIAVARPRTFAGFRDDSMFGLVAPPHEEKEWQMLGDMGAAWLQWSAVWAYMERVPGRLWYTTNSPADNAYEGYLKDANKYGIRTMIQFRTTPLWANKGKIGSYKGVEVTRGDTFPPDDEHWDDYEKFVGLVVDRFKPYGVKNYECWSEAEGSLFNRWNTPPFPKVEVYQKLLEHTRKAIKAHDSSATLGGPGDFIEFLKKAEEGYVEPPTHNNKPSEYAGSSVRGIGKAVDMVTGHFYWTDFKSKPRTHWGPEENNPGRLPSSLKEMISDAQSYAAGRPLWISEVGYGSAVSDETPDNVAASSDDEQANLLVRYFVLSRAWGAKKIFWYTWKDRKNASGGLATSYGLLRSDGTVKPAYTAYRTMTERLEGLPNVKLAEQGSNRNIVHFTGGGRTVVVIWKLRGGGKENLTLPWSKVRVTHRDGKTETVEPNGGKVQISLEAGEPVYLDQAP